MHVEVVQEWVLHLPQHPAEEEEDLLPHPRGVLAGRRGRASARAQLPICVPNFPVLAPNRMLAHPAVSGGSLQEQPPGLLPQNDAKRLMDPPPPPQLGTPSSSDQGLNSVLGIGSQGDCSPLPTALVLAMGS